MKDKKVKVQITLPEEIIEKIEEEIKKSYLSKSSWFLKLAQAYFEQKNKSSKKVIELDF
jgi:metal-responsive CopG/Arc/MetJ family transcriptional regulator